MPPFEERRRFQRISLLEEFTAILGAIEVAPADLSVRGARFESTRRFRIGETVPLQLQRIDDGVAVDCVVKRCRLDRFGEGKALFDVGVVFPDRYLEIEKLVEGELQQRLDAQRSNARGLRPNEGSEAFGIRLARRSGRSRTRNRYLRLTYDGKRWQRLATDDGQQPENGLTIMGSEGERQIDLLCRAWEERDETGRAFLRQLAEISIASTEAA